MSKGLTAVQLTRADCREMPWKNGRGTTTEILAEPPGAGFDGPAPLAWRISVARVNRPGPFSAMPGYDRNIVQLDGPPMRLDHGPDGTQALTPLLPYRFRGDWATECAMAAGEARDFNVFTRRGVAAAHVFVAEQTAGGATALQLPRTPGLVAVIYLARGAGELRANNGDGATWRLAEGEALVLRDLDEARGTLILQFDMAGCAVVVVIGESRKS